MDYAKTLIPQKVKGCDIEMPEGRTWGGDVQGVATPAQATSTHLRQSGGHRGGQNGGGLGGAAEEVVYLSEVGVAMDCSILQL